MARNIGPKCRLCRKEGTRLFLKGERCETIKCPVTKKRGIPGQHKNLMKKPTEYEVQLRAKQIMKRTYGVLERQFERYFENASKSKGMTGLNLLLTLEMRLDNVVKKIGLGGSMAQARQLVLHDKIKVNDKKVNIPSYRVKMNDKIQLDEKLKENVFVKKAVDAAVKKGIPPWLTSDAGSMSGTIVRNPLREEMSIPYDPEKPIEQLVVELFKK